MNEWGNGKSTPVKRTFHNLHTRKSIGDKYGSKSLYVVEYCNNREEQHWFCISRRINKSFSYACDEKIDLYKYWKEHYGRTTGIAWKDFKVALYVRAERECYK